MSDIPSATRLMQRTVNMIANPAKIGSQGETIMYSRPSARIDPHDGVGGVSPKPRKLNVDSRMIRNPISSMTITGTTCQTEGMT